MIDVKVGKGGDGMVVFCREKYVLDGGFVGGDGGCGGDVVLVVEEGLCILMDFWFNCYFKVIFGENGMSKGMYGCGLEDLFVKVLLGIIVCDVEIGVLIGDLIENG